MVVPGRVPWSIWVFLTQVRRASGWTPSSSAILRIAPLARAGSANASSVILVARSRSSSGYFFCPMTVILPCHHCLHQTRGDSNRGIKDVLIVCCDGLTGLPEAIEATWPQATVQTCVVHLIRAATRFVSYSDRKAVAAALRPIYQAPSEEAAWEALETFEASELGQRYPAAVRTFTDSWERFTPFLAFPPMVRRVISPPLRGRYPLHQRDRVAELPAAQGHQEPGSLPLRRGSGQAAVAGYLQHPWTREPDNGKRSSRKDGPARARPPAG